MKGKRAFLVMLKTNVVLGQPLIGCTLASACMGKRHANAEISHRPNGHVALVLLTQMALIRSHNWDACFLNLLRNPGVGILLSTSLDTDWTPCEVWNVT